MPDASPAHIARMSVRFSDCDLLGHVNNAVYFTYFEQARISWWRALSGEIGFPGANTVIVHAECDYRAPAYVDDQLDVRLFLGGIGRSSVTLTYEIVNATTGRVIAEGKTINVTVDTSTTRTIPIPGAARLLLARPPAPSETI